MLMLCVIALSSQPELPAILGRCSSKGRGREGDWDREREGLSVRLGRSAGLPYKSSNPPSIVAVEPIEHFRPPWPPRTLYAYPLTPITLSKSDSQISLYISNGQVSSRWQVKNLSQIIQVRQKYGFLFVTWKILNTIYLLLGECDDNGSEPTDTDGLECSGRNRVTALFHFLGLAFLALVFHISFPLDGNAGNRLGTAAGPRGAVRGAAS